MCGHLPHLDSLLQSLANCRCNALTLVVRMHVQSVQIPGFIHVSKADYLTVLDCHYRIMGQK